MHDHRNPPPFDRRQTAAKSLGYHCHLVCLRDLDFGCACRSGNLGPDRCSRRHRDQSRPAWRLPEYAVRTTLRMFGALAASLIFTFTYGTAAAKSQRAGIILIPVLDILQSVPILGFSDIHRHRVLHELISPGRFWVWNSHLFSRFSRARPGTCNHSVCIPVLYVLCRRTSCGGLDQFPAEPLANILAPGGAIRHPGSRLEHDDVHVRRLVFRRRIGGDLGRRQYVEASRNWLLHLPRPRRSGTLELLYGPLSQCWL